MATPAVVTGAVEGIIDEALLRRICEHVGTQAGTVYGKSGKIYLLQRLPGYNNSARHRHWAVLLDLDNDGACAPEILPVWLPLPSALMALRVAVRELEAWILADQERIAGYLAVRPAEVPANSDVLDHPKEFVIELARRSRRSDIREDIVPRPGSGQSVGPAYASRMIEFLHGREDGWRPEIAARSSDSLRRCLEALQRLSILPYPKA
jgi:hypothetical protein